nr:LLDR protein Lu5-46938 [Linum usitatissimum]FAA04150.1 TPA: flax LLDR protein Lu5-46938 [Linum usitatissimum]
MSMKSGRKGDSAALLTIASKARDAGLIPVPMFGLAETSNAPEGDAGIIDPILLIFGKLEMMARNGDAGFVPNFSVFGKEDAALFIPSFPIFGKEERMAPKGDAGFDIFFPFFGKADIMMPPKEDAGFDIFFPFFGKQAEMMTPNGDDGPSA